MLRNKVTKEGNHKPKLSIDVKQMILLLFIPNAVTGTAGFTAGPDVIKRLWGTTPVPEWFTSNFGDAALKEAAEAVSACTQGDLASLHLFLSGPFG
jgi:hypothetical protein